MNWEKCISALVAILENPFAEKGYEDLKKYYESNNLKNESAAVDYLIKNKFNDNHSNTSEKQ